MLDSPVVAADAVADTMSAARNLRALFNSIVYQIMPFYTELRATFSLRAHSSLTVFKNT